MELALLGAKAPEELPLFFGVHVNACCVELKVQVFDVRDGFYRPLPSLPCSPKLTRRI